MVAVSQQQSATSVLQMPVLGVMTRTSECTAPSVVSLKIELRPRFPTTRLHRTPFPMCHNLETIKHDLNLQSWPVVLLVMIQSIHVLISGQLGMEALITSIAFELRLPVPLIVHVLTR